MGLKERHKTEDGVGGWLNALTGAGGHKVEIVNEEGNVVATGQGSTEEAAREDAWERVKENSS